MKDKVKALFAKYQPETPEDAYYAVLMEKTCFPFGKEDEVLIMLEEYLIDPKKAEEKFLEAERAFLNRDKSLD